MNFVPRNLDEVIKQIISVVPESESTLLYDLNNCLSSAEYAPPEMENFWWIEVRGILGMHLGDPKNMANDSWQKQVYNIWMVR